MEKKTPAIEKKVWLKYFNQTLYQRGLITEKERNRLLVKIESRAT